jgi:hypothetical protein
MYLSFASQFIRQVIEPILTTGDCDDHLAALSQLPAELGTQAGGCSRHQSCGLV